MSHDITKLPKWAQSRIEVAERNADYWKAQVFEMEEGDTNVFQQDYTGDPPHRKPLARDTTIIFITEDSEITVGFRDDRLQVMSGYGRKTRLAIGPLSSNLIEVWGIE